MKPQTIHHSFHPKWRILLILLVAASSAPGQVVTNWVAYNEHRPSTAPVASGWPATAPRVSVYEMGTPTNPTGPLTNFFTGDPLTATVTSTPTGIPDDFGSVGRPVRFDTPMGQVFYGICDLSNDGLVGVRAVPPNTAESFVTITFSGLDPTKRYVFQGSVARNGGYGTRWSVAAIAAEDWTDAHLNGSGGPGVLTGINFPASGLTAGQAAFNSGANNEGAVVGWNDIAPFGDGTFNITCKQYTGAIPGGTANGPYGYSFGAFMLAEVELEAPSITGNPPASTNVEENRPFSLTLEATGAPLNYQWYKEDIGEIPGATLATYSVARAQLTDTGMYYAVVFNVLGRQTSSVAEVTVFPDTAAPTVDAIFSYPTVDFGGAATLNQIIIEFSEAVTSASVSSPGSYLLSGVGNPSSVIVTNERSVVLVLDNPLAEDTDYTVTLSGATDVVGNVAGSSDAPFHSWVSGLGNGLVMESYPVEDPAITVESLLADPDYPNNPDRRDTLRAFDSRLVYPTNDREGYGARIRGVFIPPVSGDWAFFARTRQLGLVNLNPNGLSEAGKVEILRQSTENEPFNWDRLTSSLYPLRAGRAYYIEGFYKGAVGDDYLKVAARLAGTGVPMPVDTPNTQVDTNSLAGGFIGSPLAPRDLGGALTLVTDLADINTEENQPTTLSVSLDNPSGLPVSYQWYRDGAPIAGATKSTYMLVPVLADSGATFQVEMGKLGSTASSRTATLSVRPDTTPPLVARIVSGAGDLTIIQVVFNEFIDPVSVTDPFNFTIDGAPSGTATLEADGRTVTLTWNPPLEFGQNYDLTIFGASDLAGNFTNPDPLTISFVAGEASPMLAILLDVGQITLSWSTAYTGFTLEQAAGLADPPSATVWSIVGDEPENIGGRWTVTLPQATDAIPRVFRLRQ